MSTLLILLDAAEEKENQERERAKTIQEAYKSKEDFEMNGIDRNVWAISLQGYAVNLPSSNAWLFRGEEFPKKNERPEYYIRRFLGSGKNYQCSTEICSILNSKGLVFDIKDTSIEEKVEEITFFRGDRSEGLEEVRGEGIVRNTLTKMEYSGWYEHNNLRLNDFGRIPDGPQGIYFN